MELKIETKVDPELPKSKYLLSLDEELELAARAQRGCDQSREKLIVSNIRLAYHIARSFAGLSLSYDELVSEGMFGLVVAVDKFKPSRRVRFGCYASYWIRQKMLIAIKKRSGIVRIPLKLFEKVSLIKKKEAALTARLKHPPTPEMIAHASGFSVDQVDKWLKTFSQARDGAIAMHLPSFPGSPVTISETIPDENSISPDKALEAMQEGDFLREIMQKHLKPMEIKVLSYRFGMNGTGPLTLRDTGVKIQRSGERARLIQRKAMAKLRRALTFMKK